ncbi:MAG: hypothetical protein RIS64_3450 [Bacteroidota bacterium]|jgi:DNA-binding CsgD family transcriptional regulator
MLSQLTEYHKITKQNPAAIADFLVKLQQNELPFTCNEEIRQWLELDPVFLNFLASCDNSARMILNQTNFQLLAISNNIKSVTGLDLQIKRENAFNDALASLAPKHLLMIALAIENHGYTEQANMRNYSNIMICGLTVRLPDGSNNRLLVRGAHYAYNADGYPQIALLTIDKINFMMKTDDAWMRVTYGEEHEKAVVFSSATAEQVRTNILSPRELAVLNCIAQGLDSKTIAEKLYVSVETVVKHRKNMLAKSGLCDTTALIQICRSIGILS